MTRFKKDNLRWNESMRKQKNNVAISFYILFQSIIK